MQILSTSLLNLEMLSDVATLSFYLECSVPQAFCSFKGFMKRFSPFGRFRLAAWSHLKIEPQLTQNHEIFCATPFTTYVKAAWDAAV